MKLDSETRPPMPFVVGMPFSGATLLRLMLDSHPDLAIPPGTRFVPRIALLQERGEEPIPPSDRSGYRKLREAIRDPIVLHVRPRGRDKPSKPLITTAVQEGLCDGFVISDGGVESMLTQARMAADLDMKFWLQMVGTGITGTFLLHLASVMSHAELPSVTCHRLFGEELASPPIKVEHGNALVPEEPGLGVELGLDIVERCRVEPLNQRPYPMPGQLVGIRWPSGGTSYYSHRAQYWDDFASGRLPSYVENVRLDPILNDGSEMWREIQYRAAHHGGVHMTESPI